MRINSFVHYKVSSLVTVTFYTFSEWGPWSSCTDSCGTGKQIRKKQCTGECTEEPIEEKLCNEQPCEGKMKTFKQKSHHVKYRSEYQLPLF